MALNLELLEAYAVLDALRPLRDNKPLKQAPVAQLDRVSGYEPEGREFESLRARQLIKDLAALCGFFFFRCAGICAYVSPYISRQARHYLRLRCDAIAVPPTSAPAPDEPDAAPIPGSYPRFTFEPSPSYPSPAGQIMKILLLVAPLLIAGCATELIRSSNNLVVVSARTDRSQEAKAMADQECAQGQRMAKLMRQTVDTNTLSTFHFRCITPDPCRDLPKNSKRSYCI